MALKREATIGMIGVYRILVFMNLLIAKLGKTHNK